MTRDHKKCDHARFQQAHTTKTYTGKNNKSHLQLSNTVDASVLSFVGHRWDEKSVVIVVVDLNVVVVVAAAAVITTSLMTIVRENSDTHIVSQIGCREIQFQIRQIGYSADDPDQICTVKL